jgi:ATP-dependent exoDNAse (exonuclease V) beta subunit
MSEAIFPGSPPPPADQAARERFRVEWRRNFAVSANAGSGKTTAISERLAAMALDPAGAAELRRTAVVTYTLKAAEEIGARARERLLRRLEERGAGADLAPLEQLERAFFGTLHSFCLKLAREHGHEAGLDLAPEVLDAQGEAAAWEDFLAGDSLRLEVLSPEAARWLFRLVRLEDLLEQARELEPAVAAALRRRAPKGLPPAPAVEGLEAILAIPEKGRGAENIRKTKELARVWAARAAEPASAEFLGIFQPAGDAKATVEAARAWMQGPARWAAGAAGAAAGELAERFAGWRRAAGVQTFSDQISAARELLLHPRTLASARAAGWRIILDEAQDTDEAQFSILVELARPPAARPGSWPGAGEPPLPGRFCMVGDGQQSIYGSRASVRTFQRHLEAFDGGEAGDRLDFEVTFRAPHAVVDLLNGTLPAAFSPEREHSRGLPPAEGAEAPVLQIPYQPLVAGPANAAGLAARVPLPRIGGCGRKEQVDTFRAEMREVAAWLAAIGPGGLGLAGWGELCVLMARNKWMDVAVEALEGAGLKVARQSKQQQMGDQPAFAWVAGLATVCCEPEDAHEWFGVLREVFALSDSLLAREKLRRGRFEWESPEEHPEPLRSALEALRPSVQAVDDEAVQLDRWCEGLVAACGLEAKARAADAGGAAWRELERLRAEARAGAAEGLSPRAWAERLARQRRAGRAESRSEADAITVQTCHSAKGLEWPAVLVPGLWREIGFDNPKGLQVLAETGGEPLVYLKAGDVPEEAKISRERERRRELVRLLYVTLTRPRRLLLLPWDEGITKPHEQSFASLWGHDPALVPEFAKAERSSAGELAEAPRPMIGRGVKREPELAQMERAPRPVTAGGEARPRRLLPHQLAEHGTDAARVARHESGTEELVASKAGGDPIAYGLWWHETTEFVPWLGSDAAVEAHARARLAAAEQIGAGERARAEWVLLTGSEAWRELRAKRWSRLSELAVLAPLGDEGWMDGVMDLVLHDPVAHEAWVVDWKTNRRRVEEAEEAFLTRLAAEYAPQLCAYGKSLAAMFPECRVRRLIYGTGVGRWIEV